MKELTFAQNLALSIIYESKGIDADYSSIHGSTINSLYLRGLITYWNHADRTVWELTQEGLNLIKSLTLSEFNGN